MPEPVLISSKPAHGAENVPTNQELVLTFNTPLLESSVTAGATIQLKNVERDEFLTFKVDVDENVITLYPGRALEDYTGFEIRIIGTDVGDITGAVTAEDSTELEDTIRVRFMTGTVVTVGVSEEDGQHVETSVDASGQVTITSYDDFELLSVSPADGTMFIDPDYLESPGFVLTFNHPLNPLTVSGAISVEQRAFVDRRFAVGSSDEIKELDFVNPSGQVYCPTQMDAYNEPDYTLSLDGAELTLAFASDSIKWNSQIRVTVGSTLACTSAGGSQTLGTADTTLVTTGMFPWFSELESIRLELGAANTSFSDFIIARYILRNSIQAWRLSCFRFDVCMPPYFVVDYVTKRALIDIITGPEGLSALGEEKSKSLGDFSVRYGNSIESFRTMADTWLNEALEYERWLRTMCTTNPGGLECIGAVRGTGRSDYHPLRYRERHWHGEALSGPRPGLENSKWMRVNKNPKLNETYSASYNELATDRDSR